MANNSDYGRLYNLHLKCFAYTVCILLNALLIHALHKRGKLKSLSYRLVVGLSLSDIFVGIFGLSDMFWEYNETSSKDNQLSSAIFTIYICENFCVNFSIAFVLIIAIDRYIHMKHTLMYSVYMTPKRVTMLVVLNALFTAHMTVSTAILPKYARSFLLRNLKSYHVYRVVLSLVYILLILMVCVLYLSTYLSLRHRVGSSVSSHHFPTYQNQPFPSSIAGIRRRRRQSPDQEFAKAMTIIIFTLLLCLMPNLSLSLYERATMLHQGLPYARPNSIILARRWSYLVMILNSSLNALILILCTKDLRTSIKSIFTS